MTATARIGLLVTTMCAATLRADDVPEGFSPLFNGKDLTGWKATEKPEIWAVEAGVLVCKGGGGGWLLTEKEYGDFEFRCEYRWPKAGATSGIALRTPAKGDPAYVGMEVQLIDNDGYEELSKRKLADYQRNGSVYDVQPASGDASKPVGEWNSMRVVCRGRKVSVEQNGKELVSADLDSYKDKFAKHTGLTREKGHVGFQGSNLRAEFRNIVIKEAK